MNTAQMRWACDQIDKRWPGADITTTEDFGLSVLGVADICTLNGCIEIYGRPEQIICHPDCDFDVHEKHRIPATP